jgi:phosphoribosylformylglycinamidine cyclo-ligase
MTENLPRVLPLGTAAIVDRTAWTIQPIFTWLQQAGGITDDEMFRTFNMGIGLIAIVDSAKVNLVLDQLAGQNETAAVVIGEIVSGNRLVPYTQE